MRTDHEDDNEQRTSGSVSRRRFIASAGMVVAGGALAGTALAAAELGKAKEPAPTAPAALPWPWPKLDPMEAGKRAFQYYHLKGG